MIFLQIIQSNESSVIQKHLGRLFTIITKQNRLLYKLNYRHNRLTCPSTLTSLEIIDQKLKEFVRLHHLDLLRTVNYQISKLNTMILIKTFSKQISTYHLTNKQVETFIAYFIQVLLFLLCIFLV